jgi:hypothetical protein
MELNMRPLSDNEVDAFIVERFHHADWRIARDFARDWYGPTAVSLEVETEDVYDDENSYLPTVIGVTVRDAAGTPLTPDPAAPQTARWLKDLYEGGDFHGRELPTGAELAVFLGDDDGYLAARDELPCDRWRAFDLRIEPERRWTTVYVPTPDPEPR